MHKNIATLLKLALGVCLAFFLSQSKAETLATCGSAFMREVLNTPMQKAPQDMVYVLSIFDQVKIVGPCNLHGTGANLFSSHLERLWLNEILGEDIPKAQTVREAIALEQQLQSKNDDYASRKTHQRAFTRSFSAELRGPNDPLPEIVENSPAQFEPRLPNVWTSLTQSPHPVAVAIAFTNISPRVVVWPTTTMALKDAATGKYVSFHCWTLYLGKNAEERRRISPGQRLVAQCDVSQNDWRSDEAGMALLAGLSNRDNWFLRSEASEMWSDGPNRYRRVMRQLATNDSWDKARRIVEGNSCLERDSCAMELQALPMMNSLFMRTWTGWLPGLIAGAVSLFMLRSFWPRRALLIAFALSALILAEMGGIFWSAAHFTGGGMGAVVLFFVVMAGFVGGFAGVWLAHFFLWIRARTQSPRHAGQD